MLATVDVLARTGTVVAIIVSLAAIVVSLIALYFTYKQHQRDKARRADEERERDSANLTWEVIQPALFANPAQLHVTNGGADAENLRITLSRGSETLGLNPGTVRRGMPAACGAAWPIPYDASSIDWHLDAQWDDASGPSQGHWHLTHITSHRGR